MDLGAFEGDGAGAGHVTQDPPPPTPTVPAPPAGLTAAPLSATSVSLSWTDVSNATSYNIQRRTGSGAFASLATLIGGASYTDNTAAASTSYGYQVSATNSAGTSSWSAQASATTPASGGGTPPAPGQMPDYTGPLFPADNVWNAAVDTLPVHPRSTAFVASIGAATHLHPDFGTTYDGQPIGIPYNIVGAGQAKVHVTFDYADESDPGPYPIPRNPLIEGLNGWNDPTDADRHVIVIDTSSNLLYETWYTWPDPDDTAWTAGSGAVFDLSSNALRPDGWTSSDAAGLPIFAGLVRYDEVARGEIRHALRMTADNPHIQAAYVWPARHEANSDTNPNLPPMGQRFRLKAGFDTSSFSAANQVILRAMKKYGLILADNGSDWYFTGTHDDRWDDDDLGALKSIPGSAFEAVDISQWLNNPAFNINSAAVPGGVPPDTTAPTAPTGLSNTTVSSTTIVLAWTASTDNATVAKYWVYRGGSGVVVATVTATNFTDTGRSPSTTYTYTVKAVDTSGNVGPASAALNVTTLAAGVGGGSGGGTGGGTSSSAVTTVETIVFPNPAVGKNPTIRAFVDDADTIEITIYDASGSVIHSDRVTGGPTGTAADGRPYHDYVWAGKKASGIYFAVIHGKKGGDVIRGRVKFAVVR
jgi:chitodextrinase